MPATDPKKFYLTTPIYYVNARPHIGHAYTTIVADVLARRHRLLGDDTFFLTGTDEHGQKIERSAAAAGVAPKQFADQVSQSFTNLWKRMGITNDAFIRTTDPHHIQGAQKLFADLYARGQIYLSSYTGQYSIGEEMFVDGPPGAIGPDGRPTETVTEENFFFRLNDYQLPLLNLIESGELVITPDSSRNEVLSFLRGSVAAVTTEAYDRAIGEKVAKPDPFRIAEEEGSLKKAAVGYYVPGALKDLSVSRSSFAWGIPVPDDILHAAGTSQKHVIYVWLDALANYMTAIGYGSSDPAEQKKFAHYWPADLHLVGKEITRFHCVYWPAFLLAAGLPLPKQITAHGWLLFDNSKMSKSKGNIVRTETILDAFGDHVFGKQFPDSTKAERDLFASDVLRYFLLREIPFGQDGSFSFEALITRYNADLANGYGNLVSRTLSMIEKYNDGIIPDFSLEFGDETHEGYAELINAVLHINTQARGLDSEIDHLSFATWTEHLSGLISMADGWITRLAPWKLAKSTNDLDRKVLNSLLASVAQMICIITAAAHPALPFTTAKVWLQLGLGDIEQAARNGELNNLQWGGLKPGTKLGPLAPIFPRADKGLAQIMIDMENDRTASFATTPSTHPAAAPRTASIGEPAAPLPVAGSNALTTGPDPAQIPIKTPASAPFDTITSHPPSTAAPSDASPQISIDDFVKIDLRVAQVLVAERIPKADKLLRLEVDLGYEKRQILSGIAEWYTPEDLIGRRIVVITNLAPRKMRGLESHGMLLAASADQDGKPGKPILATMAEDIALGSRLK